MTCRPHHPVLPHPRAQPTAVPVVEHQASLARGSHGQLVRRVEVMLLLPGLVDDPAGPDHEEAAVAEVGCVDHPLLPVQAHDAGGAATWRQSKRDTLITRTGGHRSARPVDICLRSVRLIHFARMKNSSKITVAQLWPLCSVKRVSPIVSFKICWHELEHRSC